MLRFLLAFAILIPAGAQAMAAPANDLAPLVSNAIARCWNPPPGSTGTVTVRFDLARDGSVVGTPKINGLASAGVAKSAVNAVNLCQPYRLPPDRYSDWQHVVVKLSLGG
ncbi:MAG: cell envelope integrity protein TolA [Devosia sp.]